MKKLSDVLVFLSIIGSVSVFTSASILAGANADAHGCNLSPDNHQCDLNRPIDLARKANQDNSFQLKYNDYNGSVELVKVVY